MLAQTARLLGQGTRANSARLFTQSTRVLQQQQPAAAASVSRSSLFKRAGKAFLKLTLFTGLAGTAYVSYQLYREKNPAPQQPQAATFPNGSPRKTLVILGSGWGAVSLLKNLDTTLYNVVVVSPKKTTSCLPLCCHLRLSVLLS